MALSARPPSTFLRLQPRRLALAAALAAVAVLTAMGPRSDSTRAAHGRRVHSCVERGAPSQRLQQGWQGLVRLPQSPPAKKD